MALQELAPLVTYLLIGVIGWISRQLWTATVTLKDDLAHLKTEIGGLSEKFVRRDDYRSDFTEIKEMLREIRNLLDGKVDK